MKGKTLCKVWNGITALLLFAVLLLLFCFIGIRMFGLKPFIITGGSMEPAYRTGSMIYVRDVNVEKIKEGDVITFYLDAVNTATHKIARIDEEEQAVYTFGTNNPDPGGNIQIDSRAVDFGDIIGTPVLCIPGLGKLYYVITTSPGVYFIALLCAAVMLISILLDRINESDIRSDRIRENGRR